MITRIDLESLEEHPGWKALLEVLDDQIEVRTRAIMEPYHKENVPYHTEFLRGEISMAETFRILPQVIAGELEDPREDQTSDAPEEDWDGVDEGELSDGT